MPKFTATKNRGIFTVKNSFIIAFAFVILTHHVSYTMEEPHKEQSPEKLKASSPERPKAFTLRLTTQQMSSLHEQNTFITLTPKQLHGLRALWFALQQNTPLSSKPSAVVKQQSVYGMALQLSPEQIEQAKATKTITLTQAIMAEIITQWIDDEPYESMPSSLSRSSSSISSTPQLLSPEASGEQILCLESPSDQFPSSDSSGGTLL
jgi:hypothetical protein